MPSPVAHISVAYLIWRSLKDKLDPGRRRLLGSRMGLFAVLAVFSVLPDVDFVPGLLARNIAEYHNQYSHSLFVACAVAVIAALLISVLQRDHFVPWLVLVFLCYGLHVIMDFFSWGRGVILWWPLSDIRVRSPFIAFYGVRWSEGFISVQHVWTVLNELAFIFLLFFTSQIVHKKDCRKKG